MLPGAVSRAIAVDRRSRRRLRRPRLTWGTLELVDGVGFIPAVVGMFGLAELIYDLINPSQFVDTAKSKIRLRDVFLTWEDFRRTFGSMVRGGFLGFFIGVLPGAGATIASFLSYGLEKRLSKTPEKFGTGMIEGVAGPEFGEQRRELGRVRAAPDARHSRLGNDRRAVREAFIHIGHPTRAALDEPRTRMSSGA